MARRKYIKWCRINPKQYVGKGLLVAPKYKRDAGFDLVVAKRTTLNPLLFAAGLREATSYGDGTHEYSIIPTNVPCGIRIALPDGIAAMVIGRSSAVINGIIVVSTLIDPGYRGDMYIFAYNMTPQPITLFEGNRIAQLVPIAAMGQALTPMEVPEPELPPSERGEAGFGSTGGNGYGHD